MVSFEKEGAIKKTIFKEYLIIWENVSEIGKLENHIWVLLIMLKYIYIQIKTLNVNVSKYFQMYQIF